MRTDLIEVIDVLVPERHRFELYVDQGAVMGLCGHCMVSFTGVTDAKELFDLVRDHCEPISD